VDGTETHQEQALRAAEWAQRLLAQPATLDWDDWGLVAALLVDSDEALERAREHDASVRLPLLPIVIEELRDVTSNFTKPAFLAATKSARRQRPSLFAPRR
jgi:hypothetical protein